MSLRTIETVLRNVPNGVTILAKDIVADLVQRGACAALPYKLTWNLPPVSFFVSRHMAQHPTVRSLVMAIRAAAGAGQLHTAWPGGAGGPPTPRGLVPPSACMSGGLVDGVRRGAPGSW